MCACVQDRFSRQIGAFGLEAMVKLIQLKVLIVGCRGVGAEVAKNIALAGVQAITLSDAAITEPRDLGLNFFLSEEDVGKDRASCTRRRLQVRIKSQIKN